MNSGLGKQLIFQRKNCNFIRNYLNNSTIYNECLINSEQTDKNTICKK